MPLPTAICKLIYTFCKIRGEKVIVRFLNAEIKYLELLLSALEGAERVQDSDADSLQWTWEERYVVLLWLSHLMLAPFDLSSISSVYMEDVDLAGIPGFFWPPNVPGITVRLLPLAVRYISSPGKERDAAKALLVRMAMRKDMQQLGVLHALVQWSLFWLRPKKDKPAQSPYQYIGVLSFLAGILTSSADTSDMDKYLSTIFYTVNAISTNDDAMSDAVKSSALAKKTIIKVMRSITVLKLRNNNPDMASMELVEMTIGHLLESLADNDTPVRLAASKALSIVTLKLDSDMASQVVEAVLESLNRNVLWIKNSADPSMPPTRDLTSVDPLEWHGLMLTLSHLLYRRSPPATNLADIVHALLLGLAFERRSPSGGSTGTNVRDAACFGIWALARRYSTAELLAVPTASVKAARSHSKDVSVLQILATELVVTASLDPAGNIRRGSSAALQELIGRHPDTVAKGIEVVQTVDYHSVALRSRAIHEVAENATKLHSQYGEALLEALLGWRGIGDADVAARRVAAVSYGTITAELSNQNLSSDLETLLGSVSNLLNHIKALQNRQVEERHGLFLALAAVFDQLSLIAKHAGMDSDGHILHMKPFIERTLPALSDILQLLKTTTFRKPELITEAASKLLTSSFPILQAAIFNLNAAHSGYAETSLLPGPTLISNLDLETFTQVVLQLDNSSGIENSQISNIITLLRDNLGVWLNRAEPDAISAASEASLILLIFSTPEQREKTIGEWAEVVRSRPTSRAGMGAGYFFALAMSYPVVAISKTHADGSKNVICEALLNRWAEDKDVDIRVSILQSLMQSEGLRHNTDHLLGLISEGLDDYTTNARGDIGSHVRLQAIRATKSLWATLEPSNTEGPGIDETVVSRLLLQILRLAAEKLDRVRVEAQSTLALVLRSRYGSLSLHRREGTLTCILSPSSQLMKSTFSSKTYFRFLLDILTNDWLHETISSAVKQNPEGWMDELMTGYVTSADTGNEDLVIASRAALADYCESTSENLNGVCMALLRNMKSRQGQDRIIVPTLEIISFLFSVGVFQRCTSVDYKNLCLQVQKAGYRTGNVRKLEACVKVYGGIAGMVEKKPLASEMLEQRRTEGIAEARKRLGALMIHPWPRVRSSVVDELWGLVSLGEDPEAAEGMLKGVDWGHAEKGAAKVLVQELGLA